MRISVGPLSWERQSGRPYFVQGHQIEPVAWVLRGGKAKVAVPLHGPVLGRVWAWVHVRPTRIQVTDPLGRRYSIAVAPRRRWGGVGLLALLVLALWLWRRYRRPARSGT
ncbi:MAG: hypothetical protein HPY83_11810 [Anaerolineae bacterium]|nr:hypothetical protein [Anaerolineae bacterium]